MLRKNFPGRIRVRRQEALERRTKDLKRHESNGSKEKAHIAKTDIDNLKKKF